MHKGTATPLTVIKERMARFGRNNMHQCYGKRCAVHMAIIDWMVAR